MHRSVPSPGRPGHAYPYSLPELSNPYRAVPHTAAGTGVALGGAAPLLSPGTAAAHGGPGGAQRRLRIIAIEEAVMLPGLPLQNPQAAVREARRAMRDLGMAGFLVNGHTCGGYLDSPRFRPVWAALEELGAALYAHPPPPPRGRLGDHARPAGTGRPAVQPGGRDRRTRAARHRRRGLRRLPRRPAHPRAHGRVPALPHAPARRADPEHRHQGAAEAEALGVPGRQHRHHHLQSHGRHHAPGRRQGGGHRQRAVAVDYPFEKSSQTVSFLRTAHLSATHREKIAHRNAERLLRL
ncbi:amidohydrolase family protein [Streptomyces sp. PGLac3x]